MKKIYFSLLLTFSIIAAFAQQQVFTKVFYHNLNSVTAGGIIKTHDHHYLIYGNYNENPLIIKMDSMGNIIKSKVFPIGYTPFRAIAPTHDSCFIIAGEGMFLVKVNQSCDTIWTRSIGYIPGNRYHVSVQETSDFGTILSETMYDNSNSETYVVVVKMNSAGEIDWSKKITSPDPRTYNSRIQQTPDSGFILFGSCKSGSPNYTTKPFLLKLSPTGDFEWAKSLDFTNNQYAEAIDMVGVEDGIALLISLNAGATNIKTDFDGNFVWGKNSNISINIEWYSNAYPKITKTSGGGFIFPGGWSDMVKLDVNGNKEWSTYIDLYSLEVIESDDGGFMVVGNGPLEGVDKLGTFNPQIGIIKTDSIGNSSECVWGGYSNLVDIVPDIQPITINVEQLSCTISCPASTIVDTAIYVDPGCVAFIGGVNENPSESLKLSIYPNPSAGIFQVGINKQDISNFAGLAIFNIMGEKVFETTDPGIFGSDIDLRAQPDGIYFIRCQMGENVLSEKIVVSHE